MSIPDEMFDEGQTQNPQTPEAPSASEQSPQQQKPEDSAAGGDKNDNQAQGTNRISERFNRLVGNLKTKDEEIERLRRENEALKVSSTLPDATKLVEKVEKMEFRDYIKESRPELAKDAEKLFEIKKSNPNLGFDDVVALHLGKSLLQSSEPTSTSNRQISTAPMSVGGKKMEDMSDAELQQLILEDRKAKGLM